MLFSERIKQLREISKLTQKEVAEVLGIDIPMYSRIERNQRKAKKEYLPLLSKLYHIGEDELTQLWLADKVYDVLADAYDTPEEVLSIVAENLVEYKKSPFKS
jgi:transcriptional regulator with XRE-family HTH domain